MAPLDERDRELLDGYETAITPSSEQVQSTWEAVADQVEHEHGARRSGWLPWVGVAAAVVAVVSYVELHTTLAGPTADEALPTQSFDQAASELDAERVTSSPGAVERRDAATPAPAAGEHSSMSLEPEPAATLSPVVEPTAPAQPTKPSKARPERATKREASTLDIGAELRLLERARAALAAEDFSQVLALADRHTREHPGGAMREELTMLRVAALCAMGPKTRWRAARSRFEREFPGSPLRAHLRDDCTP